MKPQYFIGVQLITIVLIAPWLSATHTYDDVFATQPRLVNKPWYVQVTSLLLRLLTERNQPRFVAL